MTQWGIYWFTRLDSLKDLGVAGAIAMGFIVFGLAMYSNCEETEHFKNYGVKVTCGFFFFLLMALATPTQKEAAAIWLIPKMVNSEQVKNIASDSLAILESQTKNYLSDLANEGKKK